MEFSPLDTDQSLLLKTAQSWNIPVKYTYFRDEEGQKVIHYASEGMARSLALEELYNKLPPDFLSPPEFAMLWYYNNQKVPPDTVLEFFKEWLGSGEEEVEETEEGDEDEPEQGGKGKAPPPAPP